jgi:hypothetical protein
MDFEEIQSEIERDVLRKLVVRLLMNEGETEIATQLRLKWMTEAEFMQTLIEVAERERLKSV